MRAASPEQEQILAAGSYSTGARVQVKDAAGTWRDLSTYPGFDAVDSVRVGEAVDGPHATADVVLKREACELSLAPLMLGSPINKGWNPAGSTVALLALGRELRVEVGIGMHGEAPAEWWRVFHGRIDSIDPGAGESVALACRDLGGWLADRFIERERVYGFDAGASPIKGVYIWEPLTAYALDDLVLPSGLTGYYYRCDTAGTSAATETIDWPVTIGVGVADGSVVWRCHAVTSASGKPVEQVMQSILDDTLGASVVSLYVPTSPGWAIKEFLQERVSVLAAIRALAEQIGWDVRYQWRASTGQHELTLAEPSRSKTAIDRTISPGGVRVIDALTTNVADIRNAVRVLYSDRADLTPGGSPKRKAVLVEDAPSIATYGRRFAEVAEDETSNIDTATEATALATAMLADLREPWASLGVAVYLLPMVELGDLLRLSPDGLRFSASLDVAVVAYQHELRGGGGSTTLQLRGKPSGGSDRWLRLEAGKGRKKPHARVLFAAAQAPTIEASATVGGAQLRARWGAKRGADVLDHLEYHVSATAGFVPSSATLVAMGRQEVTEISHLEPGKGYYFKAVPIGKNPPMLVRGQPSREVEFIAGRVKMAHLDPSTGGGPVPYNGSFEAYFLDVTAPPDHWSIHGGTWDDSVAAHEDDSHSGARSVRFFEGAAGQLVSAAHPVEGGRDYVLSGWVLAISSSSGDEGVVAVDWLTRAGAAVSSQDLTQGLDGLEVWTLVSSVVSAPASAAFARIRVGKTTDGGDCLWDSVRLAQST